MLPVLSSKRYSTSATSFNNPPSTISAENNRQISDINGATGISPPVWSVHGNRLALHIPTTYPSTQLMVIYLHIHIATPPLRRQRFRIISQTHKRQLVVAKIDFAKMPIDFARSGRGFRGDPVLDRGYI